MRRTVGVSMNPDSSKNTSVAPRLRAFFLDAENPLCANDRWLLHLVPSLVFKASATSSPSDKQESCVRGLHDSPHRNVEGSVPSRVETSIGHLATRALLHLGQEASQARDALGRSTAAAFQDEVSPSVLYFLEKPSSPICSPNSDSTRAAPRSGSACSLPCEAQARDVSFFQVPQHFLLVSCTTVYSYVTTYQLKKPESIVSCFMEFG